MNFTLVSISKLKKFSIIFVSFFQGCNIKRSSFQRNRAYSKRIRHKIGATSRQIGSWSCIFRRRFSGRLGGLRLALNLGWPPHCPRTSRRHCSDPHGSCRGPRTHIYCDSSAGICLRVLYVSQS